jgi:hypothetical protein
MIEYVCDKMRGGGKACMTVVEGKVKFERGNLIMEEELKCVTLTLGRILHNEPKWVVGWRLHKGSRLVLSRSRVVRVGVLKCRDR